mmetsp:Transcript_32914/g.72701  ORF Transcript_32914/g.72701 Transcript_32914/m.72701 type:complete len:87 (-) Transcript_32914:582-842(-)
MLLRQQRTGADGCIVYNRGPQPSLGVYNGGLLCNSSIQPHGVKHMAAAGHARDGGTATAHVLLCDPICSQQLMEAPCLSLHVKCEV